MKLKWIIIGAYTALFFCAYIFMLVEIKAHDEFAGIFLVLLTLPWSLVVFPLALICPQLFYGHGDLPGQVFFLIGGALNVYIIHWIFCAIDRSKPKR